MRKFKLSGQNLSEFVICVSVITAAILGMQVYFQRSLQARYKQGVDFLLTQAGVNGVCVGRQQYDPYYRESNITEGHTDTKERSGNGTLSIDSTHRQTGRVDIHSSENAN